MKCLLKSMFTVRDDDEKRQELSYCKGGYEQIIPYRAFDTSSGLLEKRIKELTT